MSGWEPEGGDWTYKIRVRGTGIVEYEHHDELKDNEEVRQLWLEKVRANETYGEELGDTLEPLVEVTRLNEIQTASEHQEVGKDEAIPMPPAPGEEEEDEEQT